MADELNTGGGSSIDGRVNTGGGGFAGRDRESQQTTINVGTQSAIDDLRTDLRLLSGEVGNLKFEQYDMRSQIAALQHEPRTPEAPALIEEQRRTNELLRLLVTLLSVLIGGSGIGGVIWIVVTVLR